MDLNAIKQQLGYSQLNLNTANDATGVPTQWLRHWDNANRVAVSIHKELVEKIQAGTAGDLAIQTETKTGSLGDYTAHRIVGYKPAEITL